PRGTRMHDERPFSAGADPLRYIDARFEPVDPIFDADEPAFPRFPRRRPRSTAAAAAALAASLACGGGARPPEHAADAILVQLERDASPPSRAPVAAEGPPIVALASVASDEDGALLRVPIDPGTDPVAAAGEAAANPGVAFAEPIYIYPRERVPND